MKDDNLGEERDPLLVRPYLLHDSGSTPADESSQTWPAATTREVPGQRAIRGIDEPTAVLALPAAPERRHARPVRRRLVLLSVVGAVVALVVGVAGLTALRTSTPPVSALPAEPLPAATGPQPSSAEASGSNGDVTTTTEATPTNRAGGGRATSATRGSGTAPATKASPTAGSGQATVKPAVPGGQEEATPASARTGAIRGQNGLCLDGSVPFDRDHVQVSRCDGSGAQTFTLASDGTLRVDGKCAEVDGDSTVQTDDCGSRGTAKWRTDGQLLINAESGRCLTDPFGGVRIGSRVMVLPCGGSARQRWSLP